MPVLVSFCPSSMILLSRATFLVFWFFGCVCAGGGVLVGGFGSLIGGGFG